MAVVVIGSVAGSPGATSLVLALATQWPRRVLVVEADVDGGRLAARCGISVRPGLTELAGAARSGLARPDDVWRFAQRTDHGVEIVAAHPAAEQVQSALRAAAAPIADALGRLDGTDVLVDVGRFRPGMTAGPLLLAADRRIVVTGSSLDDAVALVHRRDVLDGFGGADLVITAPGAHTSGELAAVVERTVLGSRPGRRARRVTARARRREDRWLERLAIELCPVDDQSVTDDRVAQPDVTDVDVDAEVAADALADELDGVAS